MNRFVLKAPYPPSGDQPAAIESLARGVLEGKRDQVLLGVTGSGKTQVYIRLIRQVLDRHYPGGFPRERYRGGLGILQQYMFYYDLKQ